MSVNYFSLTIWDKGSCAKFLLELLCFWTYYAVAKWSPTTCITYWSSISLQLGKGNDIEVLSVAFPSKECLLRCFNHLKDKTLSKTIKKPVWSILNLFQVFDERLLLFLLSIVVILKAMGYNMNLEGKVVQYVFECVPSGGNYTKVE